ncbi:IS66 family insertion sequence element accessory protein TnpB [Gluconacetobacter entanii]|nr:IS66 family insertion sequence element accessory protein TnpB [Gluconacetobacter entanii]
MKLIWHDGTGLCLYAKRIERGHFLWPSAEDGAIHLSSRIRTRYGTTRDHSSSDTSKEYGLRAGVIPH